MANPPTQKGAPTGAEIDEEARRLSEKWAVPDARPERSGDSDGTQPRTSGGSARNPDRGRRVIVEVKKAPRRT